MNDKKIEMYERSYRQEQEKIDNEKERTRMEHEKIDNEEEKMRLEQLKEEERIILLLNFILLLIFMARNSVMKMIIDDSDFDSELEIFAIAALEEEQLNNERQLGLRRSSIQGHTVIYCNRIQGHKRLYQDYFSKMPTYPPNLFRRRFQMSRCLFLRILSMVEACDPYFVQKQDAVGVLGLSSLQKMTTAMRMLAYGVAAESVNDYVRIGESTAIESLQRFVETMVAIFQMCT
ncbi:hypothetical protein ACSBR2_012124 [Camellia fascicularis]